MLLNVGSLPLSTPTLKSPESSTKSCWSDKDNPILVNVCMTIAVISLILFVFSVVMAITGCCPLTPILILGGISIISLIISCIILACIPSETYLKWAVESPRRLLFTSLFKNPFENLWLNSASLDVKALVRVAEENYVSVCDESGVPVYEPSEALLPKMLPVSLPPFPYGVERARQYVKELKSRVITNISHAPGDGNCFFHTMSELLRRRGIIITYQELRTACCQWLRENFRSNPQVCHLLYADMLTSLDTCEKRIPKGSKLDQLRALITGQLGSFIYSLCERNRVQGDVTGLNHHLLIPYEGTHPVAEVLLEEYITGLSHNGVYVACSMGLAMSHLYETTVVLYSIAPTTRWHIKLLTGDFGPQPIEQAKQVLLREGFRVFENANKSGHYMVDIGEMTRIFGAERCSEVPLIYGRSGMHFEPLATASIIGPHQEEAEPSSVVQPPAPEEAATSSVQPST